MKKYLFLFLILGLVFQACKKEEMVVDEKLPKSTEVSFRMNDGFEKTELGKKIKNPFLLRTMQEAENNVYTEKAKTLVATDMYVEFYPEDVQDIILLDEADIDYFDFPLGYEIKVMGDIYQDMEGDRLPTLYAVVKAYSRLPDVPFSIKSYLYLDDKDESIIAEAFRLTEHYSDLNNMELKRISFPNDANTPLATIPMCPDGETAVMVGPGEWDCVSCSTGFHLEFNGGPFEYDCVPDTDTGGGSGSGCVSCVTGNKRAPGGRVLVEDTELSTHGDLCTYKPVRDVKVTILSRWGWPTSTRTDDNGCWKINKKRRRHVWVRVKFSNNQCRIRATHKNNISVLWKWIVTHKSKFEKHGGPKFNNIDIVFHMWNERGINSHLNWGAATINNAVHEFHDYANAQGIATPEKLDIYATRNRRDGYSLMHSQQVPANAAAIATAGVTGIFAAPFAPIVGIVTWGSLMAYLPEVMIGIDFQHSDILKSLAYHEIAHASHFENAGQDFWNNLVATEILLNGHGSATSTNAGIVSVSESWAEHIGESFNHLTYPTANVTSIPGTWAIRLEETRNEEPDHIPIGIYNDLMDTGTEPTSFDIFGGGSGVVTDGVSGFTNAQMFSVLTPSTTNMNTFRTSLISTHLGATSNTAASVNALFASY